MTPDDYITLIETFLSTNAGVASLRHPDGRSMTLDRKQAIAELAYWQRKSDAKPIFGQSRFGLKGDA